jgi:ribosomal protein S18 acetylase RimI-like enzyme
MRRDFCRTPFEARHLDCTSRYPKAWFLLLEQRREPAGRLYIDLTGPSLHLIVIALLPAFQGRGIGTGILRALQDQAQGEGKPLSLHVQRGNDGAAALYRRLGFTLARPGGIHDHFTWAAGESRGQPAAASHE